VCLHDLTPWGRDIHKLLGQVWDLAGIISLAMPGTCPVRETVDTIAAEALE
jgi:hypothetical protein